MSTNSVTNRYDTRQATTHQTELRRKLWNAVSVAKSTIGNAVHGLQQHSNVTTTLTSRNVVLALTTAAGALSTGSIFVGAAFGLGVNYLVVKQNEQDLASGLQLNADAQKLLQKQILQAANEANIKLQKFIDDNPNHEHLHHLQTNSNSIIQKLMPDLLTTIQNTKSESDQQFLLQQQLIFNAAEMKRKMGFSNEAQVQELAKLETPFNKKIIEQELTANTEKALKDKFELALTKYLSTLDKKIS